MAQSKFFAWFDGITAEANKSAAGQFMASHGYTVAHTGGGCLAWSKDKPDSEWSVWIVDGDAGLGIEEHGLEFANARDFSCMLTHNETGDYANGPQSVSIGECIDWGYGALASPDERLEQENCTNHRNNGRGICCDCGKPL